MQVDRTDETTALIQQWNSRPVVLSWTELANAAYAEFKLPPIRQYRANGLLQTAMYDAGVAAYDAQDTYDAPAPAVVDSQITPVAGIAADRPAFPSAEAAVAGAAAAVLRALLPDAVPNRFSDLAAEAAMSRLQAGLNFRRDIDAGLALGQVIGERAIAVAADDKPASAWDGSGRLTGPGYWEPTPPGFVEAPLEPLAMTWHRWVLERADQFRPAAPPAYDSPAWKSQLAAVQEAVAKRSLIQAGKARFWQSSATSTLWDGFASDLIIRYSLDLPHAARVLALIGVAIADGEIACWDAKYTYWTERPITADPTLDVLFPTPPFPSYPSAHATSPMLRRWCWPTSSRTTRRICWIWPRKRPPPAAGRASTIPWTTTLESRSAVRWATWWRQSRVRMAPSERARPEPCEASHTRQHWRMASKRLTRLAVPQDRIRTRWRWFVSPAARRALPRTTWTAEVLVSNVAYATSSFRPVKPILGHRDHQSERRAGLDWSVQMATTPSPQSPLFCRQAVMIRKV